MKRVFIYFGALGLSALNAQTLTLSTHQPEIGNVEKVRQMDTAAFSAGLPNGTSGANALWDFSKALPLNTETLTNNYTSTSTFTNGTLFPDANIVQDMPGNMFTYYKFTTTPTVQTEIVGIVRPDIIMSFSNTGVVIQYPAGLGFTVSDDVAGTYSIGTIVGPVTGETQTTADGTGTVVLAPGVEFNDVIRVKCVQTLTLAQGTLTGKLTQVVYNYYSSTQKFPIVNISYVTESVGVGTPTITAGMFANADNYATVGIAENRKNLQLLQVFPNPASNLLYINADVRVNNALLYNMAGEKIMSGRIEGPIDLSSFQNGIYLLKLESATGTISRKIVVSH